jgi:hypothetical protein
MMDKASDRRSVRAAAQQSLAAAFAKLESTPDPVAPGFHPYLHAGRACYGPVLTQLSGFKRFETTLAKAYPYVFDPRQSSELVFPGTFCLRFLDAVVWRHASQGQRLDSRSPTTTACLEDLIDAVATRDCHVACCRLVSHTTTSGRSPIAIGDFTVIPVSDDSAVTMAVREAVPNAAYALEQELPPAYDPPHALIVVRGRGRNRFDTAAKLSRRLDRLTLLLRLLFGGTLEAFFEVSGETGLVCRHGPQVGLFRRSTLSAVRRAIRLSESDTEPVVALDELLKSVGAEPADKVVTSLGMALWKFSESFLGTPWFDQLVDLCTALEAALSGQDKDDILLRLRSRAATLLATERDPAEAIFRDVGKLYGLRSTLVQGGTVSVKDAERMTRHLSTFRDGFPPQTAVAFAVDRLRDLAGC